MSIPPKERHDPHFFHVGLKLILENEKGEILALKMPLNSSMPGYYDLPGGRINSEELENPYNKIIKREVWEEIGKKVKYHLIPNPVSIARHFYFSPKLKKKGSIFFVFFKSVYIGGSVEISSEHVNYKWLRLSNKTIPRYFMKGLREGLQNYLKWKNITV